MTAEEKVKAKWPDAVCLYFQEGATAFWGVLSHKRGRTLSATWNTEADAWQDAASRINTEVSQ
jgi:hypothetical protein